jgi:hypothetical protein
MAGMPKSMRERYEVQVVTSAWSEPAKLDGNVVGLKRIQ